MKFKNHKNHFYNRLLVENLYQWQLDDGPSYLNKDYPQEKNETLRGEI